MGHNHTSCADQPKNRTILWIAIALNFPLFVLEIWQGMAANSTALIADSMDFLSDTFSYIITLYVITKPLHTRAKASLLKAALMLLLAVAALVQGAENILGGHVPVFITMGWVSVLALAANLATALLLYRTRTCDSNMRSIWLCSRNDSITNIAIMVAAVLVFYTQTLWPDLAVALIIAWLEGGSALKIIAHAKQELREPHDH